MSRKIKSGNSKIDEINDLIEEIEALKRKLEEKREKFRDCSLIQKAEKLSITQLHPCRMACAHVLKAHNTRIHDVIWSPDDSRLISVGAENCVVFWNVKTGFIDNLVDASLQQPLTADVSLDLNTMFCGGLCACVVVYSTTRKGDDKDDYTEYTPSATLEHDSRVVYVKHIPSTNELVTCADNEGIQVWDLSTMKIKTKFGGHLQTTTTLFLLQNTSLFLSAGTDGIVKLWDSRKKQASITNFTGHVSDVTCLDVFPNQQTFISGSDDTYVQLYDFRFDKPIARYSDPVIIDMDQNRDGQAAPDQQSGAIVKPSVASVASVAITSSGRMFLTGCGDSMIYYWDVFNPNNSVYQREESGPVRKLSFSNQGHGLATVLWDAKNRLRIFVPS